MATYQGFMHHALGTCCLTVLLPALQVGISTHHTDRAQRIRRSTGLGYGPGLRPGRGGCDPAHTRPVVPARLWGGCCCLCPVRRLSPRSQEAPAFSFLSSGFSFWRRRTALGNTRGGGGSRARSWDHPAKAARRPRWSLGAPVWAQGAG